MEANELRIFFIDNQGNVWGTTDKRLPRKYKKQLNKQRKFSPNCIKGFSSDFYRPA